MNHTLIISHEGVLIKFAAPNTKVRGRVESFASKEPETLRFIDQIPPESILWDVGANVGLYSIYAAKKNIRVVAIEPSVFNLETLVRNVCENQVSHLVLVWPLPVGISSASLASMRLSSKHWGFANNQITQDEGIDTSDGGLPLHLTCAFQLESMRELIPREFRNVNYIKIDVDGLEAKILGNSSELLQSITGVLVELPEEIFLHDQIRELLRSAGLRNADSGRHNEVWLRN